MNFETGVRRFQPIISIKAHVKYIKRHLIVHMTLNLKINRQSWAWAHLKWKSTARKKVIFMNEKNPTLTGPDGLQHYCRDKCNDKNVL